MDYGAVSRLTLKTEKLGEAESESETIEVKRVACHSMYIADSFKGLPPIHRNWVVRAAGYARSAPRPVGRRPRHCKQVERYSVPWFGWV